MDEMVFFYPDGHQAHFEAGHPERPERVEVIREALQGAGFWQPYPKLPSLEVPLEVLEAVHTRAYLSLLDMVSRRGGHLDADTYLTQATQKLAYQAAGGAMAVAEAVWEGRARRGFALCRPPGHHATPGQGMGFCLLNNIALAAEFLVRRKDAQRLAIVDLDLHHGNGTQEIFWRRGDVFYLSTHQSPLYPGTGRLSETGEGPGKNANANFPLPPRAGDQAFLTAMDGLILPLLDRFMPEMILVSYGFDTHWSDPLGQLLLSAGRYALLIQRLADWAEAHAQGRIALFLEGGYNLEAAEACTLAIIPALLGQTWQDTLGPAPYPEGVAWQPILEEGRRMWGLD